MNIKIDARFRPYSHSPGVRFPIPYTCLGVQVYPSALRVFPSGELIPLAIQGPVDQFTAILDLEKGCIQVFGKAATGYFRYFLFGKGEKVCFKQDKPQAGVLPSKTPFLLVDEMHSIVPREKLYLGVSKALEWESVVKRRNMAEILPIWFYLGQMVPDTFKVAEERLSLLQEFLNAPVDAFEPSFFSVFDTGFSGLFFPVAEDSNFLGYPLEPVPSDANPFILLSEGAKKLRSLFFLENNEIAYIVNGALYHFKQGKMINIQTSFGSCDLEWTKGMMRRMIIRCSKGGKYSFVFPKTHDSCRVTFNSVQMTWDLTSPLDLEGGMEYFFDRFQK